MKMTNILKKILIGVLLFSFVETPKVCANELIYINDLTNKSEQNLLASATSTTIPGTWIKAENGRWWYKHNDGTYTKNGWEYINSAWYYFDSYGWMETGWILLNGYWYYLNSSGAMVTGWAEIGGN